MSTKILVVDDEPRYLRLLEANLRTEGYEVITAVDGMQAVETFSADPVDLILMDVHLPDMTGYEAAKEIRHREQREGTAKTAIVALTGCAPEAVSDEANAKIMDDFLEKPVSIELLRTTLINLLARRKPKMHGWS